MTGRGERSAPRRISPAPRRDDSRRVLRLLAQRRFIQVPTNDGDESKADQSPGLQARGQSGWSAGGSPGKEGMSLPPLI